jgi:hypothetical protein
MNEFDVDDFHKIVDAYMRDIDRYGELAGNSVKRAYAAGNEKLGQILERLFDVQRYGDLEQIAREIFHSWQDPSKIPLGNLQDYNDYLNEQYPDSAFSNNSEPIMVVDPARRLPPGPTCTKLLMIEGRTFWSDWSTCLEFCLEGIAEPVKNNQMTMDVALSKIEVAEEMVLSRKVSAAIRLINTCHQQNHPPEHPQEQITLLWPHPTTFSSTGVNGATNRQHPLSMIGLEPLKILCKKKGIELRFILC